MTKQSILRFTISSNTAHFRQFDSNSAAMTYPTIPGTTIRGIVGYLAGLSRDDYTNKTNAIHMSVNAYKLSGNMERIVLGLNKIKAGTTKEMNSVLINYYSTGDVKQAAKHNAEKHEMFVVRDTSDKSLLRLRILVRGISELGEEVLDRAYSRLKEAKEVGMKVPISVGKRWNLGWIDPVDCQYGPDDREGAIHPSGKVCVTGMMELSDEGEKAYTPWSMSKYRTDIEYKAITTLPLDSKENCIQMVLPAGGDLIDDNGYWVRLI